MINIIIITINLTLSVLMVALISWFENEEIKIKTLNKNHQQEIGKLQKISQINSWLKDSIHPVIKLQPNNFDEGVLNIVRFYDDNMHNYNLLIDKYFYKDEISQNIDFFYKVDTDNLTNLKELINMEFKNGFLQFLELKISQKNVSGKIQLIQSNDGDINESASK